MVFSDLFFLFVFLPLFALLYLLAARRDRHDSLLLDSPQQAYKNHVLILFSLIFYAWGEPVYVFLMLLENTIRLQRLTERRRKDKNSKRERYAPFILLTLVNLLAQISTSMGVVLLTGLIMLLSFFFLLYTKKIRSVIPAFLCCLPNVFYILLYLFYRGA